MRFTLKSEKEKLIDLLDDVNVQKKIRRIVSQSPIGCEVSDEAASENGKSTPSPAVKCDPNYDLSDKEAELAKLRAELTSTQNKLAIAEKKSGELQEAKTKLNDTQEKLQQAQKLVAALDKQVTDLKNAYVELSDKLESTKAECTQLSRQNDKIQAELADVHEQLRKNESSMSKFNEIFALYKNLPVRVKDGLQGIFNDSSLRVFIICGVQKDNLITFWDYCKTEFDRGKMEAHDALLAIFQFFFDLIKHSLPGTFLYEIQTVSIGEVFDKDSHTVAGMGVPNGKVTNVIFPGLIYATNKKVYKKSLVEVQ